MSMSACMAWSSFGELTVPEYILRVDRLGLGLQAADLVVEAPLLPQLGVAALGHLQPLALQLVVGGPLGFELGPFGQGGPPVAQPVDGAVVVLERQEIVEGGHGARA